MTRSQNKVVTWSHVDVVAVVLLQAHAEEVLSLGLVLLERRVVCFATTPDEHLNGDGVSL